MENKHIGTAVSWTDASTVTPQEDPVKEKKKQSMRENQRRKNLEMSNLQQWSKKVIKELIKHADRDGCYNCKMLIAEMAAVAGISAADFKRINN